MKRSKAILGMLLGVLAVSPVVVASAEPGSTQGGVPPGLQEVILVFKTHFDIGYTDMASNVVQRYRAAMVDQALKVAEQPIQQPMEHQFPPLERRNLVLPGAGVASGRRGG